MSGAPTPTHECLLTMAEYARINDIVRKCNKPGYECVKKAIIKVLGIGVWAEIDGKVVGLHALESLPTILTRKISEA